MEEKPAIIRLNEDGSLDEVILEDVQHFHLEQMDKDAWWIGLTMASGKRYMLNLWRKGKKIRARCEED